MARRGSLDVQINKVPGSIRLNNFVTRRGKIVNLLMSRCGRWIERVSVRLFSEGFGSHNIVTFPVEHITLVYPIQKSTYTSYTSYIQDHPEDNIVDELPYGSDNEQEENEYEYEEY
jgi:hypothetical protein